MAPPASLVMEATIFERSPLASEPMPATNDEAPWAKVEASPTAPVTKVEAPPKKVEASPTAPPTNVEASPTAPSMKVEASSKILGSALEIS